MRFDSTEQDVESNGSSIQRRLLRHKSQMFTILLNVQFCDLFAVKLGFKMSFADSARQSRITYIDLSRKRVIKPLD